MWSLNVGAAIPLAAYYNGNGKVGETLILIVIITTILLIFLVVMTMANLVQVVAYVTGKVDVELVHLLASLVVMIMVKLAKAMATRVDVGVLFVVLSLLNMDVVH